MECHLPYYALRSESDSNEDFRLLRRRGLFSRTQDETPLYLHQAMISVIVFGLDEWLWTAICCVETYFKSGENVKIYHNDGLDGPTGSGHFVSTPVWNPREYFLKVVSRRVKQVMSEWRHVITGLEDRLGPHVL